MSDDLCCPEYYCRAKKCDVEVYEDFLQVEDCISKTQVQSFFWFLIQFKLNTPFFISWKLWINLCSIQVNITLCDGFCSSTTNLEEDFEKTVKNKRESTVSIFINFSWLKKFISNLRMHLLHGCQDGFVRRRL